MGAGNWVRREGTIKTIPSFHIRSSGMRMRMRRERANDNTLFPLDGEGRRSGDTLSPFSWVEVGGSKGR